MEKVSIINRKGQNIVVLIEESPSQKGLAFVMHGLSGNKEQPHIAAFAEVFKDKGYTVVRFDTTNTFGESDGNFADITLTNCYEDLEDVISWAESQPWFQKPFYLAGHSLGGISTALYAENYPSNVKALAPISTVVTGKLALSLRPKGQVEEWEKTGWLSEKSTSRPELIKTLKWSYAKDFLKYDLLPKANQLTMPVLLIVGDQDKTTPLAHQQILFDKLPGKKELHIIKGATHTFQETRHLEEIKKIFHTWIDSIK